MMLSSQMRSVFHISFIIWNVRGIANDVSIGRVKYLIKAYNIDWIVLLEPKVNTSRMEEIWKKLGMSYGLANEDDMAHIWVLWKHPLDFSLVLCDNQQITIHQLHSASPGFYITLVYAKCSIFDRKLLWDSLKNVHNQISGPWLVGGDFNCVLTVDERLGGNPPHLDCIPSLLQQDDNISLCAAPSDSEVRDSVFKLSPDSAPGLDGFTSAIKLPGQ